MNPFAGFNYLWFLWFEKLEGKKKKKGMFLPVARFTPMRRLFFVSFKYFYRAVS